MITVQQYTTAIQALADQQPEIKDVHFVVEANQATSALKASADMQLVAVLPSADGRGELGRHIDLNTTILYVVQKPKTGKDKSEELDLYARTQANLLAIRDRIIDQVENGCSPFPQLSIHTIHIDPEHNIFGGLHGYSMAFAF